MSLFSTPLEDIPSVQAMLSTFLNGLYSQSITTDKIKHPAEGERMTMHWIPVKNNKFVVRKEL